MTLTQRDRIRLRLICRARGTLRYRTRKGEIHFYGQMPNTGHLGWYFVAHSATGLFLLDDINRAWAQEH